MQIKNVIIIRKKNKNRNENSTRLFFAINFHRGDAVSNMLRSCYNRNETVNSCSKKFEVKNKNSREKERKKKQK